MLWAVPIHGQSGKWEHQALFGMGQVNFKQMHLNTACGLSVSLNKVNSTTSKVFFPIGIIHSLHLTYLNKTCRNTWFSRADLMIVMLWAEMKEPEADLTSTPKENEKKALCKETLSADSQTQRSPYPSEMWLIPWHSWQILSCRHFWKEIVLNTRIVLLGKHPAVGFLLKRTR